MLPPDLEDAEALIKRRALAAERKEKWRSTYADGYRYAMPSRETFHWHTEGQTRNNVLYDSTLQESTYTAANTMCALLFPGWTRWAELTPGGDIDKSKVTPEILAGLRNDTEVFFDYLNHSNFAQVANEMALDLMIGTGAMDFDEGDDDNPFVFSAVPLSAIEIEEGPSGEVETTYMLRKPSGRHLLRMYDGLEMIDLPQDVAQKIVEKPEDTVEVLQTETYHPGTKRYYGIVTLVASKTHIWRYDYGPSCPKIVARATKTAGEAYGRGRVLLALSDARTLDKMQEFVLRHSALQVAPPYTAVSDGVLNPYTAVLAPNTVLPVATNDSGNPSLRVVETGGDFMVTRELMADLRQRVRRVMLGPEPTEGAVRSATEVSVNDRNRLWAMNGEMGRIQEEWLAKVVRRGIHILQRRGIISKYKVNGREVNIKYTSPFAQTQGAQDALALQNALGTMAGLGDAAAQLIAQEVAIERLPRFLFEKYGVDMSLLRTDEEKKELEAKVKANAAALQNAQGGGQPPAMPQ